MTITEKILAAHCGKEEVIPGELITVKLDSVLANDVSGPIAIREFYEMGFKEVFDRERVYIVNDHFTPNSTLNAATQSQVNRRFARDCKLEFFYDVGNVGIEHSLLPEQGLVLPGDLIIGGDSHTCTYGALGAFSTGMGSTDVAVGMGKGELWLRVPQTMKLVFNGTPSKYVTGKDYILHVIGEIGVDGALYMAMEFTGKGIEALSMDSRFTICNMAIEAGAKNGIINPDRKTCEYVEEHNRHGREYNLYQSDPDAEYIAVHEWDAGTFQPQVACPHLPSKVKPASEIGDVPIDQVIIGSCTNGRMEDLRAASEILKENKVARNVRVIVIPSTPAIYRQAMQEGLLEIFLDAGAAISTPTCGPCFGGHMGILAAGERTVSTTNRNFLGRMGHSSSEIYLAGPYVAAASAVTGKISDPREVLQ